MQSIKYIYRMVVQMDMETATKLQEMCNKLGLSRNRVVVEGINHLYNTTIAEKKGEGK